MHFGFPSRFEAFPSKTREKIPLFAHNVQCIRQSRGENQILYFLISAQRTGSYYGTTTPSDWERMQSRRKNFIIWFVKQITIRYVHMKWANVSMRLLLLCKCLARCECVGLCDAYCAHSTTSTTASRPDSAAASAFSHGFLTPDVMHKSMFVRLIIIHHTRVFKCLFGTAHHSDGSRYRCECGSVCWAYLQCV